MSTNRNDQVGNWRQMLSKSLSPAEIDLDDLWDQEEQEMTAKMMDCGSPPLSRQTSGDVLRDTADKLRRKAEALDKLANSADKLDKGSPEEQEMYDMAWKVGRNL